MSLKKKYVIKGDIQNIVVKNQTDQRHRFRVIVIQSSNLFVDTRRHAASARERARISERDRARMWGYVRLGCTIPSKSSCLAQLNKTRVAGKRESKLLLPISTRQLSRFPATFGRDERSGERETKTVAGPCIPASEQPEQLERLSHTLAGSPLVCTTCAHLQS